MTDFRWPLPTADVWGQLPDGSELRLRSPVNSDIAGLVEHGQDAVSQRWTHIPDNYTRAHAVDFLRAVARAPGTMFWIIDDPDLPGDFGGTFEVRLVDRFAAAVELGYACAPHLRGRGIVTAAVRTVTEFLFDYGVHRIQIRANPANGASCRVALSAGYRREGTARDAELLHGEWNDLDTFSRLVTDPPPDAG